MAMHPELERAIKANVSALEMIKVFTKYHSGEVEGRIVFPSRPELENGDHSESSFWDTWKPLFRHLDWFPGAVSAPSEPFLSIHKAFTRKIISWLSDSKRKSNVYLIAEARTQTKNTYENCRANAVASICYEAHRFGLPLWDGPSYYFLDIPRLCGALAVYHPPFRRILTQALIDNPESLKLPVRTQIKKLIYEPWKIIQESHPQYITAPPVIVLRFVDELRFREEELLNSIYEFSSPPHASSLLWIISVSPTLKLPIQDLLDPFLFQYTRVPVCYEGAAVDTELFLHHRFSVIRQKHEGMFHEEEVWPSEEQMSHLTRVFSGAFDSIDVVDRFVDWAGDGGPKAHLETFLVCMVDSPSPSDEQPYCALDYFYTHALSAIPPDHVLVVKQVLSIFYCGGPHFTLTPFQLACWLSLPQDIVLEVLFHFCRWALDSYTMDEVVSYMGCPFFGGFLKNPKRSGRFYAWIFGYSRLTYRASLHILSHSSNVTESLKPVGRFVPKSHATQIKTLPIYALIWVMNTGSSQSHSGWTLFRHFDFCCLAHINVSMYGAYFFPFVIELHAWDKNNSPNIVRIEPASILDRQFIDKCEGLAEPFDYEKKGDWVDLRLTGPKYLLLGLGAGTVLILLDPVQNQYAYDYVFTVYTPAMLDDM